VGKKKKAIPPRTPEDCDPVVREVVEDTRAAVEDMMKELNDMVDATAQTSPPEYIVTNVYEKPKTSFLPVRWTILCVLAMTCVWRHENLKRDGCM